MTNPKARETMEQECAQAGIKHIPFRQLDDAALLELWKLVVGVRELWAHAAHHHHRELSQLWYNGQTDLYS